MTHTRFINPDGANMTTQASISAKHAPFIDRPHPADRDGVQKVYRFENGYGASVVRFHGSYGGDSGQLELGVVKFTGDEYKLTYQTPITEDVLGYLSDSDVAAILDRIAALPAIAGAAT